MVCRSCTAVCDTAREKTAMGTAQILNIEEVCGALGEFFFSNGEGKKSIKPLFLCSLALVSSIEIN